ncbi:MAG: hypothetical protein ROZ37_11635 [Aromatoleum sp.]|jgi:glycosyltransferase involved in cell wall biosynthesis|uniref:hypothetical protein n=1 Tax=Aromatoleum sp. TaxID=2307007 RepID=UPI0028960F61|nr:hypothetical protein [Aromatoleum sp.]MDT3670968.1 hypothetical protein [Aromatoleum sp.]
MTATGATPTLRARDLQSAPDSAAAPHEASEALRRPLRIGYMPYGGTTNKYVERVIEILGAFGSVSDLPRPKSLLRRPSHVRRKFDAAILNWVEFDLVRQRDQGFSVFGFAKVLARVLAVRCVARRVIYVRHNLYPHGTRERDIERARRALDLLERLFDVVLVHSGHDLGAHRDYVPHPLYRVDDTPLTADEERVLSALPDDCYAVFGRIERYKRIEKLLAAFPASRNLLVFGAAEDPAYVEELRALAGPNVRLMPGYVSDAFAQAVIRRSRGLVLAHAERDMIVSGSLFYGLSIGARVFALESPALSWIRQRIGGEPIHVARDLPTLCAAIAADHAPAPPIAERQSLIDAEFGDRRIEAVFRRVLQS